MKKYQYKQCGLDYIWLQNGFELHQTEYGSGVSVQEADQLHELIAKMIINSPVSIRGQEVRFLRSVLDISQSSLGKLMGVTRGAVAKWEEEAKRALPDQAAHLIRYVYSDMKKDDSRLRGFCDIFEEEEEGEINQFLLEKTRRGWKATA